ncbi:MAG: carboxymuconolactone decarboxylase family protein [Deltaproteobacteria bacterium]|nr:carboxymuconolactone decarboxylase family protein [Deltaproteobacteria bacterium]
MKTECVSLLIVFFSVVLMFMITACNSNGIQFKSAQEQDPLPDGGTAWTPEIDRSERSLINPPDKIPWFSGILLRQAEKEFKKELLPGRILTWSTDLGVASGCLEYFIEKGAKKILEPRLLCLLRMQVSYYVSCPFAIDVNSAEYKDSRITEEELQGLQGLKELDTIESFAEGELVALKYAVALSKTPVSFSGELLEDVRRLFSNEEIVAIAGLSAKVNYWARLIEAWRIKPAGYTDDPLLRLDQYNTYESSK